MQNFSAPDTVLNSTTQPLNITPQLPEIPLYQENSESYGEFLFYGIFIFIGLWILMAVFDCSYKSHKYHAADGVPPPERLQMI